MDRFASYDRIQSMSTELTITIENTPNPNSLKLNVNKVLLPEGTAHFSSSKEANGERFVEELFSMSSVADIMIGNNFITVSRVSETDAWESISSFVSETIRKYYVEGEPIVKISKDDGPSKAATDVESKIIQVLEEKIRPVLARDGGDIAFHGFENGIVKLSLKGACSHCPGATATLKAGVERFLKEAIPEVKEVKRV